MATISFPSSLSSFRALLLLIFLTALSGAEDLTKFIWSGGVSAEGAVVTAKLRNPANDVRLVYLLEGAASSSAVTTPKTSAKKQNANMARFTLDSLQPGQRYRYKIQVDGVEDNRIGTFTTFPSGASDIKIAFSSCSGGIKGQQGFGGSNHKVYEQIRKEAPDLFIHMGDMHYLNIGKNDPALFHKGFEMVATAPRQRALYESLPIAYIWDDHDYGPNDSDEKSPSKEAAHRAYREAFPHYPLALGDDAQAPIAQAFSIGRVRVIITDLRSEKSQKSMADSTQKTAMGEKQKKWFKEELLRASKSHELVLWVSSIVWIQKPGKEDQWGGYATERDELADFIRGEGITNLCMLSGDAHMLAIDDGSNNTYGIGSSPLFPIFQAAPLHRPGSKKGGPYTHSPVAKPGQFGILEVKDDGAGPVTVTLIGKNSDGKIVMKHSFKSSRP